MKPHAYYYNCSPEYIHSIHSEIHDGILDSVSRLKKRQTPSEINADLFWRLTSLGWSYDTIPSLAGANFHSKFNLQTIKQMNQRNLCLTSSTLDTSWHADFGKLFEGKLVQIEAQFGKVEAMFKDFCGFRIAYAERRLALGIEIVLCDPPGYFAHRRNAIAGMANLSIAQGTLTMIGLDCPIWLIGIAE